MAIQFSQGCRSIIILHGVVQHSSSDVRLGLFIPDVTSIEIMSPFVNSVNTCICT